MWEFWKSCKSLNSGWESQKSKNPWNHFKNNQIHENLRIPYENHENHENQ